MTGGKSGDKTSQDGPCPECGRHVHKDGHHTIACSRRTAYAWGGAEA